MGGGTLKLPMKIVGGILPKLLPERCSLVNYTGFFVPDFVVTMNQKTQGRRSSKPPVDRDSEYHDL